MKDDRSGSSFSTRLLTERQFYRHPVAWVCFTVCVAFLLLYLGFRAWSESTRFYLVNGKDGIIHKIDRKSGETWAIKNGAEIKQHREQEIPSYEIAGITGRGGYDRAINYIPAFSNDNTKDKEPALTSTFSGSLYNGTDWHITKIEINLDNKEKVGTTGKNGKTIESWSRDFRTRVSIAPKENGRFSFDTGEGHWNEATEWSIRTVWGHP